MTYPIHKTKFSMNDTLMHSYVLEEQDFVSVYMLCERDLKTNDGYGFTPCQNPSGSDDPARSQVCSSR